MKQSKRKTAFRAVKMSLQIKSRLSKAVLILGIPAAFLPALIAKRLQAFTDELLRLQSGGSTVASCLELLLVLVIFFLISPANDRSAAAMFRRRVSRMNRSSSTGEVMAKSHTRARVKGTSPASSSQSAGVRLSSSVSPSRLTKTKSVCPPAMTATARCPAASTSASM